MKKLTNSLQASVLKVTRVHFLYVGVYIASIVAFDTWNLITHEGIVWRWEAAALLLIINAVCWYVARSAFAGRLPYKLVVLALVVADIMFAAQNVYWERGMASKAVALFVVPIVLSAVLQSRRAILATATFCFAAYSFVLVRYFHLHYGEGFKVELYGTILLYCGVFFITALLLLAIRPPAPRK
jgi:hypothetical protein